MIMVLMIVMGMNAPAQSSERSVQIPQPLRGLSASSVELRMKAVAELERKANEDLSVLDDALAQEAVVALLEAGNKAIAEWTAASLKTSDTGWTMGEGYSEYYAQVLGLANRIRKDHRPTDTVLLARLLRGLVFGMYNPDSEFAKDLAREGRTIVPLVEELSRAADAPSKWNAYGLIKELFAHQETGALAVTLTPASAASLRTLARNGLSDPAPDVRLLAMFAVASAKDKGAIPLLERIAQNDPDTHPGRYSVRAQAAEALRRLR